MGKFTLGTIYTLYGRRGGAELFVERLLKELSMMNNEINLIVFCNKSAYDVLKSNGINKLVYINSLDNQYEKALWLEFLSSKIIEKNGIEIFWIPSGTNSFPGKWHIPTVSTIHDLGEYRIKNKYSFARTFYRKKICIPRTIKRSSFITTISKFSSNEIKELLEYSSPIEIIPNASDPQGISEINGCPYEIISKETGVTFTQEILLCVGRIDFIGKGIDIIINGYNYIKENNQNFEIPLVFVGSLGEKSDQLINVINSKNDKQIYYLGRVSDQCLEALYKIALINILASRYEGFGITVLEALKRGKPFLCSDIEVLREVGGDFPYYFKSECIEDFANQLRKVLEDINTSSIEERMNAGIEYANKFSWEDSAKRYFEIFRNIKRNGLNRNLNLQM